MTVDALSSMRVNFDIGANKRPARGWIYAHREYTVDQSGPEVLQNINHANSGSSAAGRGHAFKAAQEHIDRLQGIIRDHEMQILVCQQTIRLLKLQQNRSNAISTLPDEILTNIWMWFADDASSDSFLCLLYITHVCSHWRTLAISRPMLWRWPCLLYPKLATNLLPRAANIPLSLVIPFEDLEGMSNVVNQEAFDLAGRLLPRARFLSLQARDSVDITEDAYDFLDRLTESDENSLNMLKSIEIVYMSRPYSPEFDIVKILRLAPSMQQIKLYNMTVFDSPSSCIKLPCLTTLEVGSDDLEDHGDPQTYPVVSIIDVLKTLGMFSQLKNLTMLDVMLPLRESDIAWLREHPQSVPLSFLRKAYLKAPLGIATAFLEHIHYPPTARISVEFDCRESAKVDDEILLQNLITTAAERMECPIPALVLNYCDEGISYHATFEVGSMESEETLPRLDFFWTRERHEFLTIIPRLSPLKHLTQLRYSLEYSDVEVWKAFGRLPNLKEVKTGGLFEYPTFLKVLAIFKSSGSSIFEPLDATEDTQLYFPQLTYASDSAAADLRETRDRIILVRETWKNRASCMNIVR